ncbi:ribosomal protein L28e [Colletotrichum tofieldiae]|nr:ribosomal protein L28e [Colletotrichum tofieldiae]
MAATLPNVSSDLIWEVVPLPRPLNLVNKHSRKAIGVVPNEKGGVKVISKNQKNGNKPAQGITEVTYGGNKSARKTYSAVARQAAAGGYRADLREAAVQRVSAIRRSQRPVKATPEKKPRGNKAKKASTETEA